MDTISQRELILRIRLLLDDPRDQSDEVRRLAGENPRSLWSTKVLYNIGKKRRAHLMRIVTPEEPAARARAAGFSNSMRCNTRSSRNTEGPR